MVIKEIVYQNSRKRTIDAQEIKEIKKNRVTVVHDECNDSPAPTSKTLLHSPLGNSISQNDGKSTEKNVNTQHSTKNSPIGILDEEYRLADEVKMLTEENARLNQLLAEKDVRLSPSLVKASAKHLLFYA